MESTAQPQFHLFSFILLIQKLTILPGKLLDLPVYHSPFPVTGTGSCAWIVVGVRDLNSGPQICTVLPTFKTQN